MTSGFAGVHRTEPGQPERRHATTRHIEPDDPSRRETADKAREMGWSDVPRPAPVSETVYRVIRSG